MVASALTVVCAAMATQWTLAAVPAGLFLASAALNLFLATRPVIELRADGIVVGEQPFLWNEIDRIERTGWVSPLVIWLLLDDGTRHLLIYPGALRASRKLSSELDRRLAAAQVSEDHVESDRSSEGSALPVPAVEPRPLLTAEDQAEVERLFQRLKTVGHLEQEDR